MTPEQQLLLQAALFSGPKALKAWETWMSQVDFDKIDPASYQLLPLVSRNPALVDSEEGILQKCKGIYRQVWVTNHLNWTMISPTLQQLAKENKVILLKGIAMILHHYKDFGVRVLGDFDIFIERSQLSIAVAFLRAQGWKPKMAPRFDLTNPEHLNRWHALHFTNAQGINLDLHWSFIQENVPLLDQAVFTHAQPLLSGLLCPSATDLLLQVCVHGMKQSPVPLIRWVADAVTLLKHSAIDWDRLLLLARQAHVCQPLSLALRYLVEEFNAPIPPDFLEQLKCAPTHRLDHLEYWCHARTYPNLAAWCRSCLNKKHLTIAQQILHLPKYLQSTARLKSLWQVPFFTLFWAIKRLLRLGSWAKRL